MRRSLLVMGLVLLAATSGHAEEAWQRSLEAAKDSLVRGDLGAAERNLNRAIRAIHRVGPEHRDVFSELQVLGAVQAQEGRLEKGSRLVERALDLAEIAYGADSPALEPFWSMLGTLELQRGEYPRAAELLDRSYRVLMGNVSTENPAFREVLRNYAEALRRSGRERDLLLLQSHYGHEVDLGPLEPAPSPPRPPPRPDPPPPPAHQEPQPAPEPEPTPEPESPREAFRQRMTQGTTELPELPALPPVQPGGDSRKIRRNLMIMNTLAYQFRTGQPAIEDHDRWIRRQLRKFRRRRRYKPELVKEVLRNAMSRGSQLAALLQPAGSAHKLWPQLTSEAEQEAARALVGSVQAYTEAFEDASSSLQELMKRLLPRE